MTTRKELIVEKYLLLETELKKYVTDDIFPSLDCIDVADLVYYITLIFLGVTTDEQYRIKIRELLTTNNIKISDTNIGIIVPLIRDFVKWMKEL